MLRRSSFGSVLLVFLLLFGDSQANSAHLDEPPDGDDGAFFALRGCHQLLGGDAGEFFSPDYLCSNPPLWCNWTVQVDPGKRVHLHLEDLTPDDTCQLKKDQVHVEDPAGRRGGHKVLLRCWREAKFTSSSNRLEVVLLIGGWPSAPYRGFYGRYQAFGPPLLYNPVEEGSDPLTAEQDGADAELDENQPVHPSAVPASTQGTSRSGRGAAQTVTGPSDSAARPGSPSEQRADENRELEPAARNPTAIRRNAEEEEEESAVGLDRMGVSEASDQPPPPSEEPEAERIHSHPNVVEPLSDHRLNLNVRNLSESPHLPGDHLFEVAVEVNFSPHLDESWDHLAWSLLQSVKSLIGDQLKAVHASLSMSSKRIKRLSGGALYILWLHIGRGPEAPRVHGDVHSALQGLIATDIATAARGSQRRAVVTSVSTADVNECGTQLVLCHANADCVNEFGSYSCRCRPGFQDASRLGSGGTVCLDVTGAGCGSGLPAETKGVYVLFFLLSALILVLLAAAGLLYRRHRRGAFCVPPPDPNNNPQHGGECCCRAVDPDLPPPPPPARGLREGWPQVKERCPAGDLPLLRFSPLLPPDGKM